MKTKLLFIFSLIFSPILAQQTYNLGWSTSGESINQQLTIDVGDTVIWTWTYGTHNLVQVGAETEPGFGEGYHSTGHVYSHTFTTPGVHAYLCSPHPSSMYGAITVNEATQSFNPGDVIITEIMQNPAGVSDNYGEWFEVFNTTMSAIDLNGWIIRDQPGSSQNVANITSSVIVPPLGHITLGRGGVTDPTSPEFNGGVNHQFIYDFGFLLANSSDEVILESPNGIVIDEVYYDNGSTYPDPTGSSMQLDPDSYDAVLNDDGANWCASVDEYGDLGELGTPSFANPACAAVCLASFAGYETSCDSSTDDEDNYSVSLNFNGTGSTTFTVTSTFGVISGDDPSVVTDGIIFISNVPEGSDVIVTLDDTADGGLCSLTSTIISPTCAPTGSVDLQLKGIIDFSVPSGGSNGKAIHVYALSDIADLSIYGLGLANNGEGSDGQEYTFDQISVNAGDHILVARNVAGISDYFTPSGIALFNHVLAGNSSISQNGNDAVELFKNNVVVETFGEINFTGGSGYYGMDWVYTDAWAYKMDDQWTYGEVDCTDGTETTFDSTCVYPLMSQLGLNDNSPNSFSIYPNPAKGQFVNIDSGQAGILQVTIFNILGNKVLQKVISNKLLDISSISRGIYLMKIDQNNTSVTKKLIIN